MDSFHFYGESKVEEDIFMEWLEALSEEAYDDESKEGAGWDEAAEMEISLWFEGEDGEYVNYTTFTLTNDRVVGMVFNQLHNLQSNAAERATESMVEYGLTFEEIKVTYDDGSSEETQSSDSWLDPI
ncbi:MAG: hypothetical protein AAFV96_02035 [Pseudomonadota bacterium]